jgi:hypothetical protein
MKLRRHREQVAISVAISKERIDGERGPKVFFGYMVHGKQLSGAKNKSPRTSDTSGALGRAGVSHG